MSDYLSSNLVAELRSDAESYYDLKADADDLGNVTARLEYAAANEIERLRAALEKMLPAYKSEVKFPKCSEHGLRFVDATEADRLKARVAQLEGALGLYQPWALADVLDELIGAAEHLLGAHQCDTHGHEDYQAAVRDGKGLLAKLRAALGEQPDETTPRLVGVDVMQPADEQWCNVCGQQGHTNCVESKR